MKDLLSVIIPIYNAEQWLGETLDSLCRQIYENIEIICVDDGSSDNSTAVVEKYQERNKRIRLIKQENSGVSQTRNRGIAEAKGKYIAFLDADDLVTETAYADMIDLLESEQSDIVFGRFMRFWPNGKKQYAMEESFLNLVRNPQDIKYFLYSTDSRVEGDKLYTLDIHGSVCRSVFKAEIIQAHTVAFHSELKFAEDQIFVLEYLLHCQKVSFLPQLVIEYRGWTKPWTYKSMYDNMMSLCDYQCAVLEKNTYYTKKQMRSLMGYCRYSAYLAIINAELMFRKDAPAALKEYYKNKKFASLNSFYDFWQKQKQKKDIKRIFLFILLKLRLFDLVMRLYPNKKY